MVKKYPAITTIFIRKIKQLQNISRSKLEPLISNPLYFIFNFNLLNPWRHRATLNHPKMLGKMFAGTFHLNALVAFKFGVHEEKLCPRFRRFGVKSFAWPERPRNLKKMTNSLQGQSYGGFHFFS